MCFLWHSSIPQELGTNETLSSNNTCKSSGPIKNGNKKSSHSEWSLEYSIIDYIISKSQLLFIIMPSYLINHACKLTKNALKFESISNSPNPYDRSDHIYNKNILWAQDRYILYNKDGHIFHKYNIVFPAEHSGCHQICEDNNNAAVHLPGGKKRTFKSSGL